MRDSLSGEGFRLRRGESDDAAFLASLATNDEIEPFMSAAAAREPAAFEEEIERAGRTPHEYGRFIVEVE